jgi:hypothetical protein
MSDTTDQLAEGLDVYDIEGSKVGKVVAFNKDLGYFETMGVLSGPRYIPFWALEDAGPGGVHLNVTKAVIAEVYRHVPAISPERSGSGEPTGRATVQSGRTGRMMPLGAEALKQVSEHIHAGTPVLDADDNDLGTIQEYDEASGYMRIERDGLTVKDIYLPVTSVSFLDDEGVHVSENADTIMHRFHRLPEVAREYFTS